MHLKRLVIPGAATLAWSRLVPADRKEQIRSSIKNRLPEKIGPVVVYERRSSRRRSMGIFGLGAFLGVVIYYFFDPDRGKGRRHKVRDMTAARFRRAGDRTRKMRVRAENKAQGIRAELQPRPDEGARMNDPTLAQKIQSEVSRDFPKGKVSVNVSNGKVVLRGELDHPDEIKSLEAAVGAVPGVREVENLTHLRGSTSPRR